MHHNYHRKQLILACKSLHLFEGAQRSPDRQPPQTPQLGQVYKETASDIHHCVHYPKIESLIIPTLITLTFSFLRLPVSLHFCRTAVVRRFRIQDNPGCRRYFGRRLLDSFILQWIVQKYKNSLMSAHGRGIGNFSSDFGHCCIDSSSMNRWSITPKTVMLSVRSVNVFSVILLRLPSRACVCRHH